VDYELNKTKEHVFGINYGSKPDKIVTFFYPTKLGDYYDYGGLLAHEVGHSYGLVIKGRPNYDTNNDRHSKNRKLDKEQGAPITAWSAVIDELWPGDQVYTMMDPAPGLDDYVYFESKTQKADKLDYYDIFDAIDQSKVASKTGALTVPAEKVAAQTTALVISGSIDEAHAARIDTSYLTTTNIAPTPVETSDFSLAFVDDRGAVLSQGGLALSAPLYADGATVAKSGVFDLIRPFPEGTARVEIRYQDKVLATLVRSANPPTVSEVRAQVSELAPVSITWDAVDEDGDPLTYSVHYSSDGGETFTPIAMGLTETEFLWDDRLSGGSSNAVIQVIGNDGLDQTDAVSAVFSLPKKKPLVEILRPAGGAKFTQGSVIVLRGAGFDPEDGMLHGAQLRWALDDSVTLETGRTVNLQRLSYRTPFGSVFSPLEVGPHSIRLVGRDSDGNERIAQTTFEILADADRDGVSDLDEQKVGRDPHMPFDVLPTFRYTAKVICGRSDGQVVSDGKYFTVINVHNPTSARVRFKKKLAAALSSGQAGPVSEFRELSLKRDQTLTIDCREIISEVSTRRSELIEGFVIIESPAELDVVTVYTAGATSGHVETLHTQRVEPIRMGSCADLIVERIEKPFWDPESDRAAIRASVRNIGSKAADSSIARIWDLNTPRQDGGQSTVTSPAPALASGAMATVTFHLPHWVYHPTASLKVQADYEEDLTECNENNNAAVFEDKG